jgi:sulfonate transport system permease protein
MSTDSPTIQTAPIRAPRAPGMLSRRLTRLAKTDAKWTLLVVLVLIGVWELASALLGRTKVAHESILPNIGTFFHTYDDLAYYWNGAFGVASPTDGGAVNVGTATLSLIQNTWVTGLRLAVGLTIGLSGSFALAILVSWSKIVRRTLWLPAHALRMAPLLAMFPLFGLWFGKEELGAVLFVALASFAIMFIVALTAIDNVPGYYEQYARSLGAGRIRSYFTVVIPAALPAMRSGVVLSLGFGWSMVIAAEFIGQTLGLGHIVQLANNYGRTDLLSVLAVFIVIFAAISYRVVGGAFDYVTRWRE